MLIGSALEKATIEELDALPTTETVGRIFMVNDRLYLGKKNGGYLEIYTNENSEDLPIISSGDGEKVVQVKTDETGYKIDNLKYKEIEITGTDIDWSLGSFFYKTIIAPTTTFTFSNTENGRYITILLIAADIGAKTISFPSGLYYDTDLQSLPITINDIDIMIRISRIQNIYYCDVYTFDAVTGP